MMSISLPKIAASVVAVGSIGGGALTLDKMHVSSGDFEQYIEQQQLADEREYVRDIKEDIRNVMDALRTRPNDDYLNDELDDQKL